MLAVGGSAQDPAAVPPLLLEDFEASTLGSRPYLWREAKRGVTEATIGTERAELNGNKANKGLKFEYTFPAAVSEDQVLEAGPGLRPAGSGQPLPGSLSAVSLWVYGDGSKNGVGVRLRDRYRERFEWSAPVTWAGWRKVDLALDPKAVTRPGPRGNGVLEPPLYLEVVRVTRLPGGAAKGEIVVDNVTAVPAFGAVTTLLDTRGGVKLDGWTARRNRATLGEVAESLVPRDGQDVPALKLEYEYENVADASVEFAKSLPAGDGHGTLIAEVFGDGSNNVLRFRMADAEGRVWTATAPTILVDWAGWKTLYVDTRTLRDPTGPDPSATLEKFPVRFHSLLIDDCSPSDNLPDVESGRKGEIYLGRLLFAREK